MLSGNKEVPTSQIAFTTQTKKKEEKIEPKHEEPKKEEIKKEIKKEIKEEKKINVEIPNQTYMMMYPYNPNQKESKPTMMFMIPMYCVETKNMPQNFSFPTMPQMPMPGMQFPFYPYPPFGMNMQQYSENK